jgi:hypothetical protein
MRSPIKALAWEIWQRGFKLASVVAGIAAICALVNHVVPDKRFLLRNFEAVYWLLMVVSLFLTFGIFHYAEHNRAKNWHGFPYRLFSLPVPTVILVACPILLGVISVESVYWIWAKLIFAPLGRTVSFWPAACLGAGMVCYQAIIWGLAGFRLTRIIVLALTGLLLADLGMVPLIEEIKIWPEKQLFRWATFILVLFSVVGAFAAWFSVERQRHGGGRGRARLRKALGRVLDRLPRRGKPFASAAAAQFWFEWRRGGHILPLCAASLLLLIFLPLSWFTRADHDSALWILGWAVLLPFVLSAVIGKGFVKPDFWSGDLSMPPFLAVRPFASGDLVVAKMKVAAVSVAMTWLLVLGFLSIYLPLWANTTELRELWQTLSLVYGAFAMSIIVVLSLIAAAILTWRLMVGSLWVGLSGSLRMFVGSAVLHVMIAVLLVWSVVWMGRLFWTHLNQLVHNFRWVGWAIVAAAVLKLCLASRSWDRITPGRTRKYLAAWWLATVCFIVFVLAVDPPFAALKHVLILAAFLPVPLARLGLAPSFLAKNRHRK